MKKLFALVFGFLFMVAPAYAGPSFSAGGGGGGTAGSLTIATDCSSVVAEGAMCWDSDNNVFYIGDGAAAAPIGPGAGAGTITNVWTVATGNVNALVAASGDTFSAASADSSIPWAVATDCSAVTGDGRACWDSDDNILYIGDGATQVKIMKSGAIVNADLAAGAAVAWSKMAALTSAHILVGNGSNVATDVAMSGDVTIDNTGATAIGANKITEAMLKAVDSASDEDILTYESTTGDFEWHTIVEMLAKIGDTRGSILERGASGWAAITPGTAAYPLISAGTNADPAYGQVTAAGITNNTITATQLSATLTFSDGDLIDLSGITHSTDTNEGLILPTWANVTTTGLTNGAVAWDESSKALKVKSASGWQSIGATAAPVDPTFLTLSNNATLTGERVLTEGTGIDFTDTGADGTLTVAVDTTEIGTTTWGSGSAIVWTFNASGGTDPTLTFGDNLITVAGGVTLGTGKNFKIGTTQWNSGDSIDGTKVADADLGDITVASGVWSVENDSHSHTSTTLPATTAYTDTADQTFTGALQTFGDADTDQLKVRSMIIGGNSREVQINASTRTAPSNPSATPTQDLYVKGNIETPGTIYSAGLNTGTGTDGTRAITMTTNTAVTPAGDQIYFINDALYFAQAGVQKTPVRIEDAQTITGKKTFQGDIAVGDTSNSGSIDIWDGSANTWTIQTGSQAGDFTLVLPTTAGVTGQYLKTTTSSTTATLSWDTPAASADTVGGTGGVQFNTGGVLTSDAGFVFTTATDKLSLGSSGGATTGTLDLYYTGTTYAATLTPNASMSGDVTITMPSYTTTLLGSGANTFTGVQGITAVNPADTGADILTMSGTLGAFNNSDVFRGLYLNYTNANHAGTANTVALIDIAAMSGDANSNFYGIRLGNFTGTTGASSEVEYGISVGTGYDRGVSSASPLYVGDGTNGTTIGATGNVSFAGTATFDATSATSSIPMTVSASTGAQTAAGQMHFESDTYILSIGDGDATPISLDFAKDATYTFPAATSTLARTDAGQTFTGVQAFTAPTVATSIAPASNDGAALGVKSTAEFSDLWLASGAVIGFANDDVTLTHSANTLTLAGGNLDLGATTLTMSGPIATTTIRVSKVWTAALESTAIPSVNGVAGNATNGLVTNPMTAAGDLITGGASGVSTGKIAAVAVGQVLASAGTTTAPAWSATPSLTSLTLGSATVDTGVFTMIKGAQTSDPQATFTLSSDGVGGFTIATANGSNGDITLTPSGGDTIITTDLTVTGADITLLSSSAGAKITGGDRTVTIVGTSADAESLVFTMGSNDNIVTVSSGTGATQLGFSALNLVTTGSILGGINRIGSFASPQTQSGAYTLAAANCYGSILFYNDTDPVNLPAAVAGMSICIYATSTAITTIEPDGTDVIVLKGAALTAGHNFTMAAAAGSYVCLVADAANHWTTLGYSGTLADGS